MRKLSGSRHADFRNAWGYTRPEWGEHQTNGVAGRRERLSHAVATGVRLYPWALRPGDLILSPTLRGDSRTMAVQSVYTNLVGLLLFLLLSPVMLVVTLLVFLFSGPGPVLQTRDCAGFQHIPFRLLRFRTTRCDATAHPTTIGKWILRMRLSNLPQLLNVIRGDMALVGPAPVRSGFARYIAEAMPFYAHHFSVKPGILSYTGMHPGAAPPFPEECRQIEYDLFYVKEGSVWLDVRIFLASLGFLPRRRI